MIDVHVQLEDLKSAAAKLSISIETGDLADEELSIQSGFCKLQGSNLIILDKKLPPQAQVDVILQALENFDLDAVYVPPWIREHLDRRSLKTPIPTRLKTPGKTQ